LKNDLLRIDVVFGGELKYLIGFLEYGCVNTSLDPTSDPKYLLWEGTNLPKSRLTLVSFRGDEEISGSVEDLITLAG
jgi:hypothetical protein